MEHAFQKLGDAIPRSPPRARFFPVILPVGACFMTWRSIVMTCVMYSAVSVPIRLSWNTPARDGALIFDAGIGLFFLADLAISFLTAFETTGKFENGSAAQAKGTDDADEGWVTDHGQIARKYLKGWFWVDAPSSIPVEMMEVYNIYVLDATQDDGVNLIASFRALRVLRLMRLLRLLKLGRFKERVEEQVRMCGNLQCTHRSQLRAHRSDASPV